VLTKIDSKVVRQFDRRFRRAWYQSASSDVVLEHDLETGALLAFEIEGEGWGRNRWFVSWGRAIGLRTGEVDLGEGDGLRYKAAPIVLWDFSVRPERIAQARRLVERSSIEEGFRESVLARLVFGP
jgi:hypothetical protein